ncbi:MAG: M3 family metallopeptidase [Gammaproteobacteria bacterium]|nr:M3 family metallopeptidase [Gammaproteobacteria bacterium]MYA37988.1 M3 family metallopeptidase [Gammaproteobacteria bacterium]MYH85899.1 M3 family metallopeptidase [Gammaproteobacteria bacterium]MYK04636.1 M3 family metallopeptidase [Gammaproteobacteria bacterium]
MNRYLKFPGAALILAALAACSGEDQAPAQDSAAEPEAAAEVQVAGNPFFAESPHYFNFPPFDLIANEHYQPAFEVGMAEQIAEVEAIAGQEAAPDFENTIVALELSGQLLNRVSSVFFALSSAHTNDDIQALQQQLAPELAAHYDAILLNRDLFARISALHESRDDLGLDPESHRLLERTHIDFIRAGAGLSEEQQEQLRDINARVAVLETRFSQNVLGEVNDVAIVVDSREELTGLDEALITAAANEAESRDLPGRFVLPLLNTSGQPSLASLQNRGLRQRILETSLSRGSRGGEYDNLETVTEVLRLRAERARLLGYENHAAYILEDETAGSVGAVNQRLAELAPPTVANARREAADLQQMIDDSGEDFTLAAWDWAYYTEILRAERFDFDESQLRPYFELDNVLLRGVFFSAEHLFGITFEERFDLPVYQEDVRVFEVFDVTGETLGLFIADFYARANKRGGAWMNAYIAQSHLLGSRPVVGNHLNITKPPEGEPTLLTFDEVTTAFHEFGHALHGLFSDVRYPSFAGTRVPRDFVEYPSQVYEMWAVWPEVLENYAVHFETGEAMPGELLDKVLSTQQFNQGFATAEYLAASIVDQALHQLAPEDVPGADEVMDFEAQALEQAGMTMDEIPPRYRVPYFSHIMGGYSAGYYSYIWSEVLDADSVEWFLENGGLLRENGVHFRRTLLSRGGAEDAMTLFRNFRGRDADINALLERRGLN